MRTCEEFGDHGVNISGQYLIDPDGQNIGQKPILVFCEFTSDRRAITKLLHDFGTPIPVGQCNSLHCWNHPIEYNRYPDSQIESLVELSKHCEQDITFGCMSTPLADDGVILGGWKGRHGKYWNRCIFFTIVGFFINA